MPIKKIKNEIEFDYKKAYNNCIALHDFNLEEVDFKAWFYYTVDLFRKYGIEPTRMGISAAPGGVKPSNKMISFSAGLKRLEQANFAYLESMEIDAHPNDLEGIAIFFAMISTRRIKPWVSNLRLCLDDSIVVYNAELFTKLALELQNFCNAKYGYYYHRKYTIGPAEYPFGTISSFGDKEVISDREQIANWMIVSHDPELRQPGDLRDVYKLNFLSKEHLDREVFGQHLEDWIKKEPYRGILTQKKDNFWVWQVEDVNIDRVRQELKPSKILVSFLNWQREIIL